MCHRKGVVNNQSYVVHIVSVNIVFWVVWKLCDTMRSGEKQRCLRKVGAKLRVVDEKHKVACGIDVCTYLDFFC